MKKKSKPLVSCDYAYKSRESKRWWRLGDVVEVPTSYRGESFAQSLKTPTRHDVDEKMILVVTCRVRGLSVKTKASKKRTR